MKPNSVRTSIDIPRSLHRKLREEAAKRGCSARSLILAAIEQIWTSRRQKAKDAYEEAKQKQRSTGSKEPLPSPTEPWLGQVPPVRVRHLYFSEKLADPNDPTSAIEFYLTVEGQTPKMFDMNSNIPDIVAEQGTIEDWIIENRSSELHAFHIHQLHFLLLQYYYHSCGIADSRGLYGIARSRLVVAAQCRLPFLHLHFHFFAGPSCQGPGRSHGTLAVW